MSKYICTLVIAALSALVAPVASAQPVATFSSSVDLVPISATVRDQHGRLVTALTSADFDVLDKGERRRILDFQSDHSSPVTLAVLLDVSGSMRMGSKLVYARETLTRLVSGLQDGRDEISLFTFDSSLRQPQPFTSYFAGIENAIADTQPFGSTSLYDAIAETASQLSLRPAPRRAIVVLTDGLDTHSHLTPSEVSGIASSVDVPVYVIITGPRIDQPRDDEVALRGPFAAGDLRDLSRWTGGDLLWVADRVEAQVYSKQILTELRQQYLIAIESSLVAEWRPLEVRVRDRKLTVRARSGYFSR